MASSDNIPKAAGQTPALRLEGVSKKYGTHEAVAPLNVTVLPGERVALLGPSGSGKTTLLMMLSGETPPSTGRILLHGSEVSQMQPGENLARLIGMIHQQFDLVPGLSALQNVLAGRLGKWHALRSLVSLFWPQERPLAQAALLRVGIANKAQLRAEILSGGEQQRVAIARVLLQDPAIIAADEPVSSLDRVRAEEMLRLLLSVTSAGKKTLIGSMHSVELAQTHFSRLIGLRNGQVQFDLPTREVTEPMLQHLYDLQGLRGA